MNKPAEQRRVGSEDGYPETRFDPKRKAMFHLDGNGEPVFHGVPEGFAWNAAGTELTQLSGTAGKAGDDGAGN